MLFRSRINSDLANDLGNLLNRTLQMIVSYRDGVVPAGKLDDPLDAELRALAKATLERVDEAMERFAFDEALKAIWALVGRANKYIDETMPWKLAKEGQEKKLDSVLLSLYEALRLSALLIAPYMPGTSRRIWEQLGLDGSPLELLYDDFVWGAGAGTRVRKAEVLFPRIDLEAWKKARGEEGARSGAPRKEGGGAASKHEPDLEHEPEIGIEAFRSVEMRVAQIVKVEEIPKSRKLYKLEVDLGYEKRTVCSGIKAFFTPGELEGRRVVLVTNLKPAKLCGIESNGMILAASVKVDGNSEALTLVAPAGEIPLGSRVS